MGTIQRFVLVTFLVAGCTQEEPELSTIDQLLSFDHLPNNLPVLNSGGFATTVSTTGSIDLTGPFFQDLGSNGRRCVSCHLPTAGWTITPLQVQAVFAVTNGGQWEDGLGLGAIFRTNDGSNSPEIGRASCRERVYHPV